MSIGHRLLIHPLSIAALALGCSGGATSTSVQTPTAAAAAESGSSEEPATAEAAPEADSNPPPPPGPAPARMQFDLARHVERADLFDGPARVVDLGVPGGAKYTLGGWTTSVRPHRFGETSAVVSRGNRARLLLPWEGEVEGGAELVLRARGFRPGKAQIYVNEEHIAEVELPADGSWGVFHVAIDAEHLRAGENELLIRVRRVGQVPGLGRGGVAIDWMRLAPSGLAGEAEPPSPDQLAIGEGDEAALAIPDGWTLAYSSLVPERARLRARVVGDAGSSLELVARADGVAPRILGSFEGGSEIDLDLEELVGRLVRLDLRAEGGPLSVVRPALVTLDRPAITEAPRPKNVVVFLIDTLRADKLSPYAPSTRVRTPGLDSFVSQATTFASAHSQENWTKPSVATLLSSLMPWEHTAVRSESVVPRSVEMLPEVLKADGFFTGCFIANGYVSDRFGFDQGWDTYRNYIREGRRTRAEFVAADVLSWLDERPSEEPFFLYVHTIDPHVPYRPPNAILESYGGGDYRGPVSGGRTATLLEEIKTGRLQLNARDRRQLQALYDGEITYHDVHFAAILEGLESRGLADDTMIVITSDHGEEFFDHGSVGHGHSVYEELVHVPLFVRLPGVTEGLRRLDVPVGLVDVMPTILEALGVEGPEGMSGASFLGALEGRDQSAPRATVSAFMDAWRTVTIGRYKLIHRTRGRFALHDLEEDPTESNDLSAERPLMVRHLRAALGLELRASSAHRAAAPRSSGARRPPPAASQHRAEDTEIDEETDAQLRALGYIGTQRR